jgi:hypothetical protein
MAVAERELTRVEPPTFTVARLTDESDLTAASREALRHYYLTRDAMHAAKAALEARLIAEAEQLFEAYDTLATEYHAAERELQLVEIKRHLPGLAIAIDVIVNDHEIGWLDRIGVCCTDEEEADDGDR